MSDRLKNHFTSLISTISYTIYALLPTLQPQILEYFPVEETSLALQGLSSMSSSMTSSAREGREGDAPGESLLLQSQITDGAVGQSWASEFQRNDANAANERSGYGENDANGGGESDTGLTQEDGSLLGDSMHGMETDDTVCPFRDIQGRC
jgi:peroxin-3